MKLPNLLFLCLFSSFFLMISCSSGAGTEEKDKPINLSVDLNQFSLGLYEKVDFNIISNVDLIQACIQVEPWSPTSEVHKRCMNNDLGRSVPASISMSTTGSKTVTITVQDMNGNVGEHQFNIQVGLEKTLRIKKISLTKYQGMGETLDPEFSSDDPNRLADLAFLIEKRFSGINIDENNLSNIGDFFSETLSNEGEMSWDLTGNEIILGDKMSFFFSLYDIDDNGAMENLIESAPYLILDFSSYIETRPTQVTFQDELDTITVVFDIEWN